MATAGVTASTKRRYKRIPDNNKSGMSRGRGNRSADGSEVTRSSSSSEYSHYREDRHGRALRRKSSRTVIMAGKNRSRTTLSTSASRHKHRDRRHRSTSNLKRHESSTSRRQASTRHVYKVPVKEQRSELYSISEATKSDHDKPDESDKSESEEVEVREEGKGGREEVRDPEIIVIVKKSSRPSMRSRQSSRHHSHHGRSTQKSSRSELRSERVTRSSSHRPRRPSLNEPIADIIKKSASSRDVREIHEDRSRSTLVKRSHSTGSSFLRPQHTGSSTMGSTNKRSSFFGLFTPTVPVIPETRHVECLTCLSDDIPIEKSAKLECGHRMCQSCLKRIFKLSVQDPQHMPPRCCTSEHIPLKHVDKLFNVEFKRTWNKKYQEFNTKNRIYCPGKRCGEWIRPQHMKRDRNGMKYGKCSRCDTKVCCLCSAKWHGDRECPKDEETLRILEAAKREGWQRCYNCRAMVELKEGCNHMTCRCTAEFCMICGLKWKTCNCPWFNYDQIEADRLNNMRIPEPVPNRPRNYDDEVNGRRRQERMDERLARRLQRLDLHDDDYYGEDISGGVGDVLGVGNAQDHFLNDNFVMDRTIFARPMDEANAAADQFLRAQRDRMRLRQQGVYEDPVVAPIPVTEEVLDRPVRRHSMRERRNAPAERVIHRRLGSDYAAEAARHAPRSVERRQRQRESDALAAAARASVMAGLPGRGSGRVNTWRSHVEAGEPEGGAFNEVEGY